MTITIFIHIPRTAGTTLQAIAREQYAPNEICRIYGNDIANVNHGIVRWANSVPTSAQLRFVTGHIAYGIHTRTEWLRWLDGPYAYVTFLRDPIERVLSVYHYIRRSPGHHLHKYARGMSLIDFMESGVTTELDNGMTRQISGVCGELPQKVGTISCIMFDPQATLETAKQNLAKFAVVGITERFAESMQQFRDVLGWKIGKHKRMVKVVNALGGGPQELTFNNDQLHLNMLRGRPHAQDVGAKTLEVIERYNRLDQELYEYGKGLFEERGG